MAHWRRRSVLSTGVALAAGAALTAVGTAGAESGTATVDGTTAEAEQGWSSSRGNAGNTGFVPADGAFPEPETIAWSYDRTGDLAAVGDAVYLRTGSELHALEDADGSVRWTADGIDAAGVPAVAGDTVYVGGGQLTALAAASGDPRWTTSLDGESTAPTVVDDAVYLVADGELLAIDAADGETIWRREEVVLERTDADAAADVEDADVGFAALPVAVTDGTVYAAVGEGTGHEGTAGFAAFDAATGETSWTYWEQWRWDPHGYVMATEDRVYTGSIGDGETYPVLDAETGTERERLSYRFPPAMTDETRVTTDRHEFSSAVPGEPESWSEGGGTDAWRRPVIVGETVIVPYYPGDETVDALYGFDLEDGTEQWTFTHADLDIGDLSEWYAASEDTVYASASGDEDGERLVAIRAGDGEATDGDEDSEDGESEDEGADNEPEDDAEEESDDSDSEDESDGNSETDDTDDSGSEPEGSDEADSEPDEAGSDPEDGSSSDDAEDDGLEEGSESGDGTDPGDDPNDGSDGTTDDSDAGGSSEGNRDDDSSGTDGEDDGYAGEEAGSEANSTDDGDNETDDPGNDGSTAEDSNDGARDVDENSSAADQNGDEDDGTADSDEADEMPGFTAGVGVVSGALGLEWLRRRASVDEDVTE
ncbi:outer membrane protein assembly factor BamB family protein [Natronococcus occultus]|nr:PQQ-binding-like beta-propeller repeat protein [Natronococcus occultus]